jgi:hypothetical protein
MNHHVPSTKINVIGAKLTDQIKENFIEHGFLKFENTNFGFTAEITGQQPL